MDYLLRTEQLEKNFGGIVAINKLDLNVKKGEVIGLIGPNGSGKTTVLNVVTGVYKPTGGKIFFNGEEIQGLTPHAVCQKGIGRTFQNIRILGSQTVYDNIRLGAHINTKANLFDILVGTRKEKEENKRLKVEIEEVLDFIGFPQYINEYAKNLPYGILKVLEIGRALMAKPSLLLLDEPAAGLNSSEKEELMKLVEKISKKGISILLIEHEMKFVEGLSDRVFVINYGKKISEGTYDFVKKDKAVIEAYLGTGREKKNA